MRIERVELKNFKRFTNLVVEQIPKSAKLILLVGPNGSGKTSFLEAINHYYMINGFRSVGDVHYLCKGGKDEQEKNKNWSNAINDLVTISFYDMKSSQGNSNSEIRGHFYFRSAYRNEPDFNISSMHRLDDPTSSIRLNSLIQNDLTVSSNYQRLISRTISGIYNPENDKKVICDFRNEITGKISLALKNVFDDLEFTSLGDPLRDGCFYFSKGKVKDFHYKNLSAGEKAAFDLILDLVIQSQYYSDAVYCIDEPEIHMHTLLQSKVLHEIFDLIPGNSQLWLSTHSIGMLEEAERISSIHPGEVVFLDFGDRDFDDEQIIRPTIISRTVLNKFYELALGDFSSLILPKTIVFCEGDSKGKARKDFDKCIYTLLFENTHPEAFFISAGSCNDIENLDQHLGEIMSTLLDNANVIKLVDRDDRNPQEVEALNRQNIKTLSLRNLESYLLDDSVIKKLCESKGCSDKYKECIIKKQDAINKGISQGKPSDDLKSAKGEIYLAIKKILGLTGCGNTADAFLQYIMAPLVTEDMDIYKKLETDIFG